MQEDSDFKSEVCSWGEASYSLHVTVIIHANLLLGLN